MTRKKNNHFSRYCNK